MSATPRRMQTSYTEGHKPPRTISPVRSPMRPLLFLANAFINTFGITQPGPRGAERAARFIAALLVGVLLLVAAVAVVLHLAFRSR